MMARITQLCASAFTRLAPALVLYGMALATGLADDRDPPSASPGHAAVAGPWAPDISALVHEAYAQFHAHPELGNTEHQTRRYLLEKLQEAGIDRFVPSERAPTAVIALLDSGRSGPTLALRAEMDARETTENPQHAPRSTIEGLMHNCGHDVHAAMLLGAAVHFHRHPEQYAGQLLIIFQPAEEIRGGADDIVEEGILEAHSVDAIIAQHVASNLSVGAVSISPGALLAGSNYFTLTVFGGGSHAAMPSGGGDTVVAAAKLVAGLADLPARRLDLLERPLIISPTAIASNTQSSNVIPGEVEVRGTIRAFENLAEPAKGQQSIEALIRGYLDGASQALGVRYELTLRRGAPPTINDDALYRALVPGLQRQWPGQVKTDDKRGMFAEDFSYYTEVVPALYFGLGVARDGRGTAGVHSPDFNIHPDALREGTELLARLVRIYSGHCVQHPGDLVCEAD